MATLLQTQQLGAIQGKSSDGVTQYRGIKYATLENRLADAVLYEGNGDGVLDATEDGPAAVSLPIGCDLELSHIQNALPKKDLPQSDLDCLNLNIAVPANVTSSSRLPVFLFIHGGGLVIGANSWPQFDYARLVKLSIEKNLPIVAVSINYRLGALGFLTSEELRNAGYKANNGLRDQRVAIEWVRKHIHEFGGDLDNITVAGMSAGGASVTYHLNSEKALFKRAISMSGTYFLTQPLPYEAHEQNYQKAVSALGLSGAAPEVRIKALLEIPAEDIVSRLPPSILAVPAVDGDIVPSAPSRAETGRSNSSEPRGKNWCHELMIGDAQMDASIIAFLYPHIKELCAKKFFKAIHTALPSQPSVADEVLKSYGLTDENASDEEAYPSILNFINDALFFTPVLTFAQGWKGPTYVYYFNEGNPWEGPWQGRSNHILDLAYFFQNFRESLSPSQQAVATAFAEDFFKFCHGQAPWPAITPGTVTNGFAARCYGPSSEGITVGTVDRAFGEKSQRRSNFFDVADKVGPDDLAKVFNVFMSM
ncbi:Alpha/Beta hydrolase protein [Aspergillus pseudodeflectus]|uniref:Carboxylic ester hydrolase n=1 Tax=Aspergillus pseudodeflectus TaxID=176178 RepID=A0ABR4KV80_9EURO